jgi:hypothetical protein
MAGEQFKGNPEKQMRDYNEGDFQSTDPVTGEARELPEDTSNIPIEQMNNPNDPTVSGNAAGDQDYESTAWNKDSLQAEADRRGVSVKGSGEGGNVLKADLIKALRKADKA